MKQPLSNLFHRQPRLLALTLILILVSGLGALTVLPRSEDPELTARNATIFAAFPGADAARVEALVLDPIEDALTEFEEIKETFGFARPGLATLMVELLDEIDEVDEVWSRIRDELGDVAIQLPAGALEPEFVEAKISAWTFIVGLTAEEGIEDASGILSRLGEDVAERMRAIPGTEDTALHGEVDEEIVVEVDPALLAAQGLDAAAVSAAIAASDAKVSAGQLRGSYEIQVEVSGELDSLERIENIPLKAGAGSRFVRLADVARVRKAWLEPTPREAWLGGERGVTVSARMLSGRRVDLWAAAARDTLQELRLELPRGVRAEVLFDQSAYTEERLGTLVANFGLGALLVMLVILGTMGWRSALLVGAALPLTTLMVLQGLRILGIPLHQMSITGLILALGLLIDNAIVMVDEVGKRRRTTESLAAAISAAVSALAVPLLGSTVTTALAFAPIALMPGGAGEFVGSIAVSVILAVTSSLFLSLTVLPALQGLALRSSSREAGRGSWWSDGLQLPGLARGYRRLLTLLFRVPALGLLAGLTLPLLGFMQANKLEEQFFPPADRDQFQLELELPQSTALAETRRVARDARELLLAHPRVEEVHWFLGESGPKVYYNFLEDKRNTPHFGSALVLLDSERDSIELIRQLQDELDAAFPMARFLARQIEQGPPFSAPIELRVFGPDLDRLRSLGDELRAELAAIDGVTHTRSTIKPGQPKLELHLDEEEARLAGLRNVEVAADLAASLDGIPAGSLLEATEELPVRVRLAEEDRADLGRLRDLELSTPGGWTPLAALGGLELVPELGTIPHKDGRRVNTIQAFLDAGTLPSPVLEEVLARLEARGFEVPLGYELAVGGESAKRDEAVGNLASTAGILLVLMLAALVLSFNSFRMALLIGTVGILSVGLSLGSLWLWGFPFGFMGIVGTMGLMGVAINDSIVVLASIREHEASRCGSAEGLAEVVLGSSRHVFSTSLTTMAGFTPLLLQGGGFWPPVAVAIGGGVAGATILAITWVPALYRVLMCRGEEPSRERARLEAPRPLEAAASA